MSNFDALSQVHEEETPQTQPVFKRKDEMQQNQAGGYSFKMTDWDAFDRFLLCGTEGGTYYVGEKDLTLEMATATKRVIQTDGIRLVNHVSHISFEGRAPSNDEAIFILAMAITYGNGKTKEEAFKVIPSVIRTGTHMLHFASFIDSMRGWGAGLRKAIQKWYLNRPVDLLVFQILKYRQRDKWSQRDILRKVHPRPKSQEMSAVFWFTCNHLLKVEEDTKNLIKSNPDRFEEFMGFVVPKDVPERIRQYIRLQAEDDDREVAKILKSHSWMGHEMVRTEHRKSNAVNRELLYNMPLTATIRNLRNMTKNGVLVPLSDMVEDIARRIEDQDLIIRQRVHPFQVLKAINAYDPKCVPWWKTKDDDYSPIPRIQQALENAYVKAFRNVQPIDKRVYIAVDISGSMSSSISSSRSNRKTDSLEISCYMAAACLAQVIARSASRHVLYAFDTKMIELPAIRASNSFSTVLKNMGEWQGGGTDVALPMLDAMEHNLEVDAFIILTDGQFWAGDMHPFQALKKYRKHSGINAKLLSIIMCSDYKTTVADPEDPGMLDISGMDASVPQVIHEFLEK